MQWESHPDLVESDEEPESTFTQSTAKRKRALTEESTFKAIEKMLKTMDTTGINLPILLEAISWGNTNVLLHSTELPGILDRWWKPHRSSAGMRRPAGATIVMTDIITRELKELGPLLRLPAGEDVKAAELTAAGIERMTEQMKANAPMLWKLLYESLTYGTTGITTRKTPDKVIFTVISMACYYMSHHWNRLPKLLAIYLKFRGVSAKGFDTLHIMGLTMSHKWACDVVKRMTAETTKEVAERMEDCPWVISYDNVNIPFRVFSQRLENQSELGHGTAATVYIKRDAELLSEETTMKDIVLRALIDSPEFDLLSYQERKHLLKRPHPIDALPVGSEHTTTQFMLGTVPIPEVSYEDNRRLVLEWFRQLGFITKEQCIKLAMKKVVTWVGDQLTVDRLRHIFTFRADDDNSFDRLDFSVFIFGWLHLQMAFANSLHKQYLGTAKGRGLAQAFELLKKKKLHTTRTQGTFYHDIVETIYEVATAHVREDWLAVGGVNSLDKLRQRSARDLKKLAAKIVETRASSEGMDQVENSPNPDMVLWQAIMWNCDALQYIVLDEAIKNGDVGMMEALLPTLLFRFIGGGNGKYAVEVLELLQGLHREWPEKLCTFIRHHCWLVNFSGKRGVWCPIDKAQEMNIKDIKVTYRSEGPNIKWSYLKKLHPAIPLIRIIIDYIEKQFGTLVRGKRHAVPSRERDINKLRKSYADSQLHTSKPGRTVKGEKEKARDFITGGALNGRGRGLTIVGVGADGGEAGGRSGASSVAIVQRTGIGRGFGLGGRGVAGVEGGMFSLREADERVL
ncbi:hypothetical protein DFP72DRAFT_989671 [Ephemerocybe angulata]|uniref:DUF6589 domain-containing protein n=1 Tax=Ephemerocybe angulata TaxID=980116 RepID=A0A8H6I255_9AGAR|nr:hypothetical protein DFP72DRAFT_989671 [Tulosesus angulatus]